MSTMPQTSVAAPALPVTQAESAAVPILPSADLARTVACYSYLGFGVLGRAEDYLRIARDDIELHFYLDPGHDQLANSAGCYLRVSDPNALRAGWAADGVDCLDMPVPSYYGPTFFAIVDPDGNTLRIGPRHGRS
jgi:catechol 2,3-dioxygenase-like lactoylglutathione lyase family enzyme